MKRFTPILLACIATLVGSDSMASGGPVFTYGIVYTRGLVLGPNNAPIFAEFDSNGVASSIPSLANGGEAVGELADAQVMSAATYRGLEQAYRQYLADNETGIAQGARVMTAQEYQSANLGSIEVPPDLTLPVPRVPLLQGSRSALIRDNQTITDPRFLGDRGVILFEAPIDLSEGNLQTLGQEIVSLIVDGDGRVVYSSQNNIGYRAAYIRPDEGVGDPEQDHISIYRRGDQLWGGIDGALIESTLGGLSTTSEGRFTVIDFIPPCPGFSFLYDFNIYATLAYRNFNPQSPRPYNSYYFRTSAFEICWGYGEVPLGFSLAGLSATLALQGIGAGLSFIDPFFTQKMPVDIVLFNGLGEVSNPDGTTLPVEGETEYDAAVADFADMAPAHLDLDFDGATDWVSDPGSVPSAPGDPSLVGVYLGETGQYGNFDNNVPRDADGNPVDPDLVRLADQAADFEDRGLLNRISVEDLENTDIYVYRVSNGQLIVSKEGLDRVIGTAQGVDEAADRFYYKLIVPGPKSGFAVGGGSNVEAWQQRVGVEQSLVGRNIDSLRPGEPVKIVAINRATGYIGSVTLPIEAPSGGFLDFPVERILMQPPNLKARVERLYEVEYGATAGQEREYIVGSEGSALTSDTYIALYTEWLDQDGTPLPDDLEGFSARLAKIAGDNQLVPSGGSVEFFEIKPGKHMHVLKLEGDILGTEHFYMHVNGAKTSNQSDFAPGDGSGVLEFRPGRYVPIRVPIFDEEATIQARNAAAYSGSNPNEVKPLYRWPYRPEMQFSVFDLNIQKLLRTSMDGELQVDENGDPVNLLDLTGPSILSSDMSLELVYDLIENEYDPLAFFGPGRDLMFSLAGYEQSVTAGQNQTLVFDNLDYLGQVGAAGQLALSMLQNSDAANVLWEFAFLGFAIGVDYDRDRKISFGDSDQTSAEKPFKFWINDDFDVVTISGDIDLSYNTCPGFLGNQICDEADINNLIYLPSNPDIDLRSNAVKFNPDDPLNNKIESRRDLEDFAGLELQVPEVYFERVQYSSEFKYSFWLEATAGVEINLFRGAWEEELNYALDEETAQRQMYRERWKFLDASGLEIHPLSFEDGRMKLIFEVVDNTINEDSTIDFVVKDGDGNEVERDTLYVEFKPFYEFYEHYTAGDTADIHTVPAAAQLVSESLNYDSDPGLMIEGHEEEYIVFVHGWRMRPWERRRFAETAYKRLYWQGYKGHYGFFSWPTEHFDLPPEEDWWDIISTIWAATPNAQNYSRSEAVARRTGPKLHDLLVELRGKYSDLNIFAHSMGNVVTSEALRTAVQNQSGPLVGAYVASQAAEVADAYNPNSPQEISYRDWLLWNGLGLLSQIIVPPDRYTFANLPSQHTVSPLPNPPEPLTGYYYEGIRSMAGRIISFYNRIDPATSDAWEKQQKTKPDAGILPDADEDYYVAPVWNYAPLVVDFNVLHPSQSVVIDRFYKTPTIFDTVQLFWQTDRPEIIAHMLPSRSKALGTEPAAFGAEISGVVNVQAARFGATDPRLYHSAQFLANSQIRKNYYRQLLREFGLAILDE